MLDNIPDNFIVSNKSIILCLITLCVHLLILRFLYSPYNELGIIKNYKIEVDSLNKINDSLYSEIKYHNIEIEHYEEEISYLGHQKQTVIIKYKTKINEIDTLNHNNLVAEFDSIFSKFNYK